MSTVMKLLKMEIRNFKGCKERDINFSHRTSISGKNEAGKTTINDTFTWVLFGKDSEGNTKFDVRPQDAEGNQIDFIDISVKLFMEINGKPVEIEKVQKQNWVKKRGSEEQTFEGNVNSYVVNTIPKSEKEFKKYIDEVVSEDIFKFVSNTNAFMNLASKDRRKTLFELVADIDNEQVFATDEKLKAGLQEELSKYSYDEILARDKKALSEWKKKEIEIPSRIDEVSRKIVEVDYTETEIKLVGLRKELAEVSEVGADQVSKYQEISDIKGKILTEKSKLQEIEMNGKQAASKDKNELKQALLDAESLHSDNTRILASSITRKNQIEKDVEYESEQKKKLQSQFTKIKEMIFDESKTVCSACGQDYDADRKNEMRENFEKDKKLKMHEINVEGGSLVKRIEKLKTELAEVEKIIPDLEKEVSDSQKQVNDIKSKIDQLPKKDFDVMECKEYLDVLAVIEQLQKDLSTSEESVKDVELLKNQAAEQKKVIQEQIDECNHVLNGKKEIENARLRVEELKEEQRSIGQSIATTEKEIFLLEEFNKAKVNLLSDKINEHFKVVKWKLFERQINGGYNEVCEPMVKGKSYTTALNSGHKILAELDIINALQKIYDCSVPVFLDNAERINSFNVPDMDCQLITLSVADNEILEVKEV